MTSGKKKAYLGALVVTAVALAVDRCFLTDRAPRDAVAVERPGAESPAEPDNVNSQKATEASSIPQIPFPHGLEPFEPGSDLRDPFDLPSSVRERVQAARRTDNEDPSMKTQARAGELSRVDFGAKHRLQGVVVHERLKIAIVNGRWLRLGQALDGCILTAVADNAARFDCFDGESILEVTQERHLGGGD